MNETRDGQLESRNIWVLKMGCRKEWQLVWIVILLTGCTTASHSSDAVLSFPLPIRKTSMPSVSAIRRNRTMPMLWFDWPLKGQILYRFQDLKGDVLNKGIDIQAPFGTPISAAQDGTISFVSEQIKGFGHVIIVDHRDGYQTVYAHSSENLVKVGESVKKHQPIARLGATGRASTPHLHFEIRRNHKPVNPLDYLTKAI